MAAEDDFIYWQDVLEAVQSGRSSNLKCPFCYKGDVALSKGERLTRLTCQNPECRQFIEGRFASEDLAD